VEEKFIPILGEQSAGKAPHERGNPITQREAAPGKGKKEEKRGRHTNTRGGLHWSPLKGKNDANEGKTSPEKKGQEEWQKSRFPRYASRRRKHSQKKKEEGISGKEASPKWSPSFRGQVVVFGSGRGN